MSRSQACIIEIQEFASFTSIQFDAPSKVKIAAVLLSQLSPEFLVILAENKPVKIHKCLICSTKCETLERLSETNEQRMERILKSAKFVLPNTSELQSLF